MVSSIQVFATDGAPTDTDQEEAKKN